MSGLSLDSPIDVLFVRSMDENGIRVGEEHHSGAIILTPTEIITDWPPTKLAELEDVHLEALLAIGADVVLIGVGRRQQFIHPARLAPFYEKGVGVEVMTTEAACRTFNILASDGRRVAAGLMPLDSD